MLNKILSPKEIKNLFDIMSEDLDKLTTDIAEIRERLKKGMDIFTESKDIMTLIKHPKQDKEIYVGNFITMHKYALGKMITRQLFLTLSLNKLKAVNEAG